MSDPERVHKFRGLGLEIDFPFPPYGVQRAMLNKVTQTLTNKQHSLIESPTGTGKTLVLLCSSLAWIRKSKQLRQPFISKTLRKKFAQEKMEKMMQKHCSCGRRQTRNDFDELNEAKGSKKIKIDLPESQLTSPYFKNEYELDDDVCYKKVPKKEDKDMICLDVSDDEDCIVIDDGKKDCMMQQELQQEVKPDPPKKQSDFYSISKPSKIEEDMCINCAAIESEKLLAENLDSENLDEADDFCGKSRAKIPRIYYGTRTHKQITQVIRELNKTTYKKDLRMCILSSRERTCINDEVKDLASRNDKCQELIKNKQASGMSKKAKLAGETCPFYSDTNTLTQIFENINIDYNTKAWDIENAATFGRENMACPYFGTRSLQIEADITFCPYNYLLDPNIRKSLDINLNNSIIIFDEAHNIEDICRDSASFVIDTKQIDDILETIQIASSHYLQGSAIMDAYQFFRDKFLNMKGFLKNYKFNNSCDGGDYIEKDILTPAEMILRLESIGLGPESLSLVKDNLKSLRGDDESESGEKSSSKESENQPALSFQQMQFILQLSMTMDFIYSCNKTHREDFRGVITKSLEREFGRFNSNRGTQAPTVRPQGDVDVYVWRFSLLCMNPGVAFKKVQDSAWSVIVASGTLAPIESLKSELGCAFDNVHEGSHVIEAERVFAAVLSRGPKKIDLNCAYNNALRLDFQDEIGSILRDICRAVPNGVLCFFPSYDRMESFYQRWMQRKIMADIMKSGKKVFRERKNMTPDDFEKDLASFYKHANMKGALLFAVFRGKVSEGIDFADKAARAVVTIGIPYPSIKEVTVDLKKGYNDLARAQKPHLMTGRDWYTSQAFRALNQALGRCIRHKADWGAVIMIDSRLLWGNSTKNISRWLQRVMNVNSDYEVVHDCLKEFVAARALEDVESMNFGA